MPGRQPKKLTELAFESFTAYMKNEALYLLNWMEVSPISIDEVTKSCRELKDFFHGTRLPPVLANEITKWLLYMLDMFSEIYKSMRKDYFQQILMTLVEVFMHPNVTSIELGPCYLYESGYRYCEFILTLILTKVGNLQNLKTMSADFRMSVNLKDIKLVLPAQLKDLTLYGSLCSHKDHQKSVVQCCHELKSLKIAVSDISVPDILKLNRLETLHLLGQDCYGFEEDCVALINGISTDATSDVLSASTLKSFGTELRDKKTLHLIVDKLPHLTEIVLELPREFDLYCLTRLKNLRSLSLNAGGRTTSNYKKILPVLGKSLVSLDLRGYRFLDLEFIGETCSNLRCLHVNTVVGVKTHRKPSLKSFPNFRTVECLKVDMFEDTDRMEFIIMQCVNIKVLSVVNASEPMIIESILKETCLKNLEEIHWYPEVGIQNSCLEELCMKSPNLRLVHGLDSYSIITGFSFHECHKSFCEYHCYAANDMKSLVIAATGLDKRQSPQNIKCTFRCLLESSFLMAEGEFAVELVKSLSDFIPYEPLKKMVIYNFESCANQVAVKAELEDKSSRFFGYG